ncbi:MAG TPA: hypothetical protein VEC99_00215 [Clostridia bacterium]|nr:hypothetical protein [Clostridia bacterium]
MPLDSPEAYERLSQHLSAVDPIIEDFCRETGFTRQTTGISRYAMRRLVLHREVQWFIELRMLEDEHGQRYETFFPDIPYWLGGGAWLDLNGYRYGSDSVITFERLPFRLLVSQLAEGLRTTWQRIRGHTVDQLVSLGPRVKLNLHPRIEIAPEHGNRG